jgi:hypothetical protein
MNKFLQELLYHLADLGIDITEMAKNANGKITPIKKPSFATKVVDSQQLKKLLDTGIMTKEQVIDKAKELAEVAINNGLNDFELQRAKNNIVSVKPFLKDEPITNVYQLKTGEQVPAEGLESILQSHGLIASPKTTLGKSQLQLKQAEQQLKDMIEKAVGGQQPSLSDYLIQSGKDQIKYSEMEKEGMKRAEARQILEHPEIKDKLTEDQLKRLNGPSLSENDPLKIYEEVFGSKAHQLLPGTGDLDQAQTVAQKLLNAKDAKGLDVEHPDFDQESAINKLLKFFKPEEKAKGGVVRKHYGEGDWVVKGGIAAAKKVEDILKRIKELEGDNVKSIADKKEYNQLLSDYIDSLDPRKANKGLDLKRKHLDTESRLILQAENKNLDFDTFEKLRRALYGGPGGKQQTLDFIKTGKINTNPVSIPTTFDEVQELHKDAAKAAEEIFPDYRDPRTAAHSLAEVMAEQKYGKNYDDISGDKQLDLYSQAHDYITSVNRLSKSPPPGRPVPPTGEINISDPKVAESFTNFIKQNDPEGFAKIQKIVDDINNKNELENFDTTDRKPNANGGLNYLLGF